jgi:ATP-dependent Clp protease ATP-binding subunit ClpA
MRWLTSTATRVMPFAFILMAMVVVAQFWIQHGPSGSILTEYARSTATLLQQGSWLIFGLAVLSWFVVIASYFHERRRARYAIVKGNSWIMDVLDRLTNRQILEQKLATEPDSVLIDADRLAEALKSKVIGQDAVCEDMAAQIRRRLALKQRGKPVGVFMLAGPPGTGKTYLAKRLSSELNRKLLHFDMTQLSSGHGATQLFGASKGYVGSDSYGKLTAGLRDAPDAVVLLDEIEKSHSDVQKNFLTAWNDGFITEASDGKQISTTGAIFVMTTNAATDALQSLSSTYAHDPDELRRSATNAMREGGYAPEVLNRIDRIFIFKRLSGLDVARVTALEIEAMIKSYGLDVSAGGIDPDVLIAMMRRHDRQGDAASSRDLVRSIEESIADSLILAKQNGHTRVLLVADGQAVIAKPDA